MALDPGGKLLIPTNEGLARPNPSSAGWEIVTADDGLGINDIAAVVQDREGSIWFGMLGSGLARWLGYNEWQGWNEREGLSRASVWSIARDPQGRIWAGTQFGLNVSTTVNGRTLWRRQPVPGMEMIRSLAIGTDGTVWIGGDPGGLRRLNPETGAVAALGTVDGLNQEAIQQIGIDQEQRLWVATRKGLLRSTGPARASGDLRFERMVLPGQHSGQPETFRSIYVGPKGTVWAAGELGLGRFNQGTWTRLGVKDGLQSNMVSHVAEDRDGNVWVGYRDAFGVSRVSFQGGRAKVENFGLNNGLRSDKAIFLGFDARGWLWAGTDHGADVFDGVRWSHYGSADGLIWDDCNANAFLAEPGRRRLDRHQPGPLAIRASSSSTAAGVPPPVVFTSVKAGRASDRSRRFHSTFPMADRSLQVRFAALTFVQEADVQFRYRLEGAQTGMETQQRELNYPASPAGSIHAGGGGQNAKGLGVRNRLG